MEAYRLSRAPFFAGRLSGAGAAIKGARWNSIGIELVYAASNRSLAMAEVAVHLTLATLPADYVMITIFIPDNTSVQKINTAGLPDNQNIFPPSTATQIIGDSFIKDGKHCILQVPSAITIGDYNLINPHHAEAIDIKVVSVEPFPFDERIFR